MENGTPPATHVAGHSPLGRPSTNDQSTRSAKDQHNCASGVRRKTKRKARRPDGESIVSSSFNDVLSVRRLGAQIRIWRKKCGSLNSTYSFLITLANSGNSRRNSKSSPVFSSSTNWGASFPDCLIASMASNALSTQRFRLAASSTASAANE